MFKAQGKSLNIGLVVLFPFGTSAGDEMLLPETGSQDGTSDGTNLNITCTFFQTEEDTIFVSFDCDRVSRTTCMLSIKRSNAWKLMIMNISNRLEPQGSSVHHAIEVAVVQLAQVRLVEHNWERPSLY